MLILTTKENDKVISLLAKIIEDENAPDPSDGEVVIKEFTMAKESYPRGSSKDNRRDS